MLNKVIDMFVRIIAMWVGFAIIMTILSVIGTSIPFILWLLGVVVSGGLWATLCFSKLVSYSR